MCQGGFRRRIPRSVLLTAALLGMAFQGLPAQGQRMPGRGLSYQALESYGIGGYAVDAFRPAQGGISRDPLGLGILDLLLHLHLDPIPGLRRTQLRIHLQGSHGSSISAGIGDLQGVSNLDAEAGWRLYEAWIQRQVLHTGVSLLAGLYDVNSEFDVLPAAGDFLNASFGFGPEIALGGKGGPSTYPNTGLALRVRAQVTPLLYALLGAGDGVVEGRGQDRFKLDSREGAQIFFEAGFRRGNLEMPSPAAGSSPLQRRGWGRGRGPGGLGRQGRRAGRGRFLEDVSTKVALGGWAYTRRLPGLSAGTSSGRSWGLYLLGEQQIYRKPDGTRALSAFARVGAASGAVNQVELSLRGGVTLQGPLPNRPDDRFGVGIVYAKNGPDFLRAQREAADPREEGETVVEITYRVEWGQFLALQPDVQWVMNPGMDPGLDNALVFGLRGHVELRHVFGGRTPQGNR